MRVTARRGDGEVLPRASAGVAARWPSRTAEAPTTGPPTGPVKGSYPPYLPELPELRVIIKEASGVAQLAEGDDGVSLLRHYTWALPAHRKSTQRLPSTLKQTPGDRVFDHDEVNDVDIIIEKRLKEETVDNDRAFSRRLDGAHKKRFAEKQNAKSSTSSAAAELVLRDRKNRSGLSRSNSVARV
ncbi:hypothetical protein HPB47_003633 [Ixodes persulcatus]|uniref:Uncharacterized protein n=1 Tax=Ixodes persulcatus TaxID=34615 RepID=A0AC60PJ14_IXOPE|nr:hypothetical protein HPB47_003633 [Ixodes persulcatus]